MGIVRPFDNSFIAWGLRHYDHRIQAARIAAGILDAADSYAGQLPEAVGGYERSSTKFPIQYPTACSPQAWSTGEPLLFLRTMLDPEPDRRAPSRRPGAAGRHRAHRAARHPRSMWPHVRVQPRSGRHRPPLHGHPQLGDPAQLHTR